MRWLRTVLLCGLLGCSSGENPELRVLPLGGELRVQSAQGVLDLTSFRGRLVWLFFGYTSCPDACPTTLSRLARARELLGPSEIDRHVDTLFVSVDPERDSPEKIAQYLAYYGGRSYGGTATLDELRALTKSYGAAFEKTPGQTPTSYLVDHSTYVYLIDGFGRVRHLFSHQDTPERIAEITTDLVDEGSCGIKR